MESGDANRWFPDSAVSSGRYPEDKPETAIVNIGFQGAFARDTRRTASSRRTSIRRREDAQFSSLLIEELVYVCWSYPASIRRDSKPENFYQNDPSPRGIEAVTIRHNPNFILFRERKEPVPDRTERPNGKRETVRGRLARFAIRWVSHDGNAVPKRTQLYIRVYIISYTYWIYIIYNEIIYVNTCILNIYIMSAFARV